MTEEQRKALMKLGLSGADIKNLIHVLRDRVHDRQKIYCSEYLGLLHKLELLDEQLNGYRK